MRKANVAWNFGFSPSMCGRKAIEIDGRSLSEVFAELPLPHEFDRRGVVRINDMGIPRHLWPRVSLNNNSLVPLAVTLHMAPRDPGTAIVATTAKGATAAALTAAAINFVIGLALQLIVNALTKPAERPEVEKGQDNISSLDSNVLDTNNPLPRVIGTHRVFPPLIVHPLVELRKEDEYVEAVMALAGPHKIDEVYSGEALLYDRVSGVSEMDGVEIQVREGFTTDDPVTTVIRQSYTDETRYEMSAHSFVSDSFTVLESSNATLKDALNVVWDGTQFVAVRRNSNQIMTSSDGVAWSVSAAAPQNLYSVKYVNGLLVVLGDRNYIGSSADGGATWQASYGPFGTNTVRDIGWSGTQYVMSQGSRRAYYSPTLPTASWTLSNLGSTGYAFNSTVLGVETNGSTVILVGENGGNAISTDGGVTYVSSNGIRAIWGTVEPANDVKDIATNGTTYVITGGSTSGRVATSTDGITWTNRTLPGWTGVTSRVEWAGGQFVIVGDAGQVATSPDGITWTRSTTLASTPWGASTIQGIAWDGTKYVVVGTSSSTASSTDLVNWSFSPQASGSALPEWHTVATREAPDEFWVQLSLPSGLYDGDDPLKFIRVPFRVQMRQRGATVWENLPEVHLQSRRGTQVKATIKIQWGDFPGKVTPPASYGWVFGSPRTQAQGLAPANPAWATSAYWGDTGAYSYTTSAVVGTMDNVRLVEDIAEFWLDPAIYPKGRYEFRVKRGYAIQASTFLVASYMTNIAPAAVRDPFWYLDLAAGATIVESQENRTSTSYITRVSSVWNEHPTPITGDMTIIAIRAKNQQMPAIHCTASGWVNDWDGAGWNTLTTTSNPAPHFRYLLNSSIASDPLPTTMIDDTSIVAWRAHCAAKGYECNVVLQDTATKTALDMVAGNGFALPIQSETWGVSWERDRSAEAVVQIFTPANSKNFGFKKGFARFTDALRCQFRDANQNYEPREEFVAAVGGNTVTPRVEQKEYAGLVTSTEVTRRAGYDLAEQKFRTVFYTLDADADAIVCRRGDLVMVQSDVLTGVASTGYVSAKTTAAGNITSLTFDRAITLGAGPNVIAVRGYDGTILTATVAEVSITTDTLTLTSALADSAEVDDGALVMAGEGGKTWRRLIVTDITYQADYVATVTLADEAPELLALI